MKFAFFTTLGISNLDLAGAEIKLGFSDTLPELVKVPMKLLDEFLLMVSSCGSICDSWQTIWSGLSPKSLMIDSLIFTMAFRGVSRSWDSAFVSST